MELLLHRSEYLVNLIEPVTAKAYDVHNFDMHADINLASSHFQISPKLVICTKISN